MLTWTRWWPKCDSVVGSATLQQSSCCISLLRPTCFGSFRIVAWTAQIDGAGLRVDAEFKMAKKIRRHEMQGSETGKKRKIQNPFKCTLACRGVCGLHLRAQHGRLEMHMSISCSPYVAIAVLRAITMLRRGCLVLSASITERRMLYTHWPQSERSGLKRCTVPPALLSVTKCVKAACLASSRCCRCRVGPSSPTMALSENASWRPS